MLIILFCIDRRENGCSICYINLQWKYKIKILDFMFDFCLNITSTFYFWKDSSAEEEQQYPQTTSGYPYLLELKETVTLSLDTFYT